MLVPDTTLPVRMAENVTVQVAEPPAIKGIVTTTFVSVAISPVVTAVPAEHPANVTFPGPVFAVEKVAVGFQVITVLKAGPVPVVAEFVKVTVYEMVSKASPVVGVRVDDKVTDGRTTSTETMLVLIAVHRPPEEHAP